MKTKLNGILTLLLALVVQISFAQEKTISGTVSDESGPLPGVSILIKGTKKGTETNFDGKYTIKANSGDVLVFRYLGYKTIQKTIGASSTINLKMQEDANVLDEIVVNSRSVFDVSEEISNGVSSLGVEELKTTLATVSIDKALQGNLSGVNVIGNNQAPGAGASVNIRGSFSPTQGLLSPLYVVDGTYMDASDVVSINSQNIASVVALTDASQTALYGSRGANGVIIITTKRGKAGEYRISLNTRTGISQRFDRLIDIMNSNQKLAYENELSTLTDPLTGSNLGLGRARTAQEIADAALVNNDWADILYKIGSSNSYNLSISGGSENVTNRFSLGYDEEEGIVVGYNGFQRLAVSFANDTKLNDRIKFGYTVNGTYSTNDDPRDRQNVQSPFWSEFRNNPYVTLYQEDASGNQILDADGNPQFNNTNLNSFGYQVQDEIFGTDQERRNLRIFGSTYLDINIAKGLNIRTQFGGNYDRLQTETFLKPSARLNTFIGTQGTKRDVSQDRFDYNWRNEISYEKTINQHFFKITAASEYSDTQNYRLNLNSRTFQNDIFDTQNVAGSIDQTSLTSRFRVARYGYLGVLNYDYDKKYLFSGYFRRDGSSLAGLENQFGNFYGASLGWEISKEAFLESADWIKGLKISASYGTLGDDSVIGLYSNFSGVSTGTQYGTNPAALVNTLVANPQTTWESNEKFNVGIKFELLEQSRLRGKFDYFVDTREDFLFQQDFSFEGGSYDSFINAGDSRTKGLELDLSYDVFKNSEGFNMTLSGNITKLDNEITSLIQPQYLNNFSGGQSVHQVGSEAFTYNLVRYAGVDPSNGDALYLDSNGDITNVFSAQNAVAIEGKSPLADYFGGFNVNLDYKGFTLTTNFNFSIGNYIYNQNSAALHDFSDWRNNRAVTATNFWRQPGDTNVLARPNSSGIEGNTTQFLQDGSYLAWRNLTLAYNVKQNILDRLSINSLRIYTQIQGLAIWSAFDGNPEVGDGSTENAPTVAVAGQVNINTYPRVKTISVGLDINF